MIDSIRQYLIEQPIEYVFAGTAVASAVLGIAFSGLVAKVRSKKATEDHEERMAAINLETVKEQRQIAETSIAVELRNLDYAETQKQHERALEQARESRQREIDNRAYKDAKITELAEKLGPSLKEIAESVRNYSPAPQDEDIARQRADYRANLFGELEDAIRETYDPSQEDFNITDEDIERLERFVDSKFPVQEQTPRLAPEVSRLIQLLERELS